MLVDYMNEHKLLKEQLIGGINYGITQNLRRARVRFLAGAKYFSLLYSVRTGSEAHPASYPMSTGGSFTGGTAGGT
jgi:hypothetical protein